MEGGGVAFLAFVWSVEGLVVYVPIPLGDAALFVTPLCLCLAAAAAHGQTSR